MKLVLTYWPTNDHKNSQRPEYFSVFRSFRTRNKNLAEVSACWDDCHVYRGLGKTMVQLKNGLLDKFRLRDRVVN